VRPPTLIAGCDVATTAPRVRLAWLFGLSLAASLAAFGRVSPGGAEPLKEPFAADKMRAMETYGGADAVKLLAGLLADRDPLVRQRAVRGLGQTHNPAALPYIRRAAKDESYAVRCEAVAAAGEFTPEQAGTIVLEALGANRRQVVLAALATAQRMKLASADTRVRALLDRQDKIIRTAALETLSRLGLAATAQRLKPLLASSSPVVRLRAVQNALYLGGGDAAQLLEDLRRLARRDVPAVRGAAISALGKFDFPAAGPLLQKAGGDSDALIRRGAVVGYTHAMQAKHIGAFLDDTSAMVRLAAIRSAGKLKCTDCAARLFELLLLARDEQTHLAARRSLGRLGAEAGAVLAAKALKDQYERLGRARSELDIASAKPKSSGDAKAAFENAKRTKDLLTRNIRSCCRLLGDYRSKQGYDLQLQILESEQTDSPLLIDSGEALGKIGDKRAVAPLNNLLGRCAVLGRKYLIEQMKIIPRYVPYHEDVTSSVIVALGRLEAVETVDTMLTIARTRVSALGMELRLNWETACVAKVLPGLIRPGNRAKIEQAVADLLGDGAYGLIARFELAKAAGKLGIRPAVPALEKILQQDRPTRPVMHAAAWAIQQITGATPPIGAPRANPGRSWIIRPLGR